MNRVSPILPGVLVLGVGFSIALWAKVLHSRDDVNQEIENQPALVDDGPKAAVMLEQAAEVVERAKREGVAVGQVARHPIWGYRGQLLVAVASPSHVGGIYAQTDRPLHALPKAESALHRAAIRPLLITNAGMYHPDRTPVGLLVVDNVDHAPLNTQSGQPGNFFMAPNGVFAVSGSNKVKATVTRTAKYQPARYVRFATQSGPMLIENGRINPRFRANSANKYIRSAVGVRKDGRVVFALSESPISFHQLARFMLAELGAHNALYLDGAISRAWVRGQARAIDGSFAGMLWMGRTPSSF